LPAESYKAKDVHDHIQMAATDEVVELVEEDRFPCLEKACLCHWDILVYFP